MEKYVTWYRLLLKERLHTAGMYLQILAMLFIAFSITRTTLPDTGNVTVGIVCSKSERAEAIFNRLCSFSDVYDFVALDSEEELKKQVEGARLECGFVFDEGFDRCLEREELTDSIRFYCSQTTTKGEAVAETVYAQVLEEYSGQLLGDAQQRLYKEKDSLRQDKIMERFYGYLDSDEVFRVTVCRVKTDPAAKTPETAVYPLQGMLGMLAALSIFLAGLRRWNPGVAFYKALDRRETRRFFMIDACAAGTVPMALCFGIVITNPGSRGFGTELVHMLVFFGYTVCWCSFAGRRFRSYLGMLAAVPVYVVANMLICPAIFDIVTYVPAMKFIRILFPLGIYLY